MDATLTVGVILLAGFTFGELAVACGLPKITGYLVAGVCLNPGVLPLVPAQFPDHTQLVTSVALAFITFSVGGTLRRSQLRSLGRSIAWITALEAELAMLAVALGTVLTASLSGWPALGPWSPRLWALALLLGALASPTDPSATLAVSHEYGAKGPVASTIMGVAAFDDVFGIVTFSLGTAAAGALLGGPGAHSGGGMGGAAWAIAGGCALGAAFGIGLGGATSVLRRESEGALIVVLLGVMALCFGLARVLGVDELLATMTMGAVVANMNPLRHRIFAMLQRYTEELVFVLFFTLSGMHLKPAALGSGFGLIALFIVLRAVGKFSGTKLGAAIARSPRAVRRYAAFGLLPQGGIVIGLALTIKTEAAFAPVADTLISVVIGATVIHELIGPVAARAALRRAGEIAPRRPLR